MSLLKDRDYTRKKLFEKLKANGYPDECIEKAVQYVSSYGYIDDKRYAVNYIISLSLIHISLWLSVLLIAIGIAVTFILSMRIKDDNLPVVRFGCMFSNAAYMGFPLIQALFGSEGLIYASAFVTVFKMCIRDSSITITKNLIELR